MNDNKVSLVGIVFLILCLALAWGVYFVNGQLQVLKEEYDGLERTKANLGRDRDGLREQISVFKDAFASLEEYNVRAAPSDGFDSLVRNVIQPYIDSGEVSIASSAGRESAGGRSSISFKLRGNYYSLLRILADWRNMDITVRVSQFSMMALSGADAQAGDVESDVTLEAAIAVAR